MKTNYRFLLIVIVLFNSIVSFSQVTQLNNQRPSVGDNFLGWNNSGTSGSLQIRNDHNQPIYF